MSNNKIDKSDKKRDSIISLGAKIAGGAAGGALGLLVGGPGGVIAGGVLAPVIAKTFKDITNRLLSNKEQERVGAAGIFVVKKIEKILSDGGKIRDDLSDEQIENSHEIFEGVLLKARDSYQEKKVKLIANIYANFVFAKDVSLEQTIQVLNKIDKLSYRQLCFLAIVKLNKTNLLWKENFKNVNFKDNKQMYETISLLEDIHNLTTEGLLICKKPNQKTYDYLLGWHDVFPTFMKFTLLGQILTALTNVNEIPDEDLSPLFSLLSEEEITYKNTKSN